MLHGVVNGPRIYGMQGVRGSNPLSSTRHNASADLPLRAACQQIVSRSRFVIDGPLQALTHSRLTGIPDSAAGGVSFGQRQSRWQPVDPGELARTLSDGLKPVLPLLVTAGDTATEMVVGRALTALERWGTRVWQRLRRSSTPESTAVEIAARNVVERPGDHDAAASLPAQLLRLLEADPELAADLAVLAEEGQRTGVLTVAAGPRSVAVGGDLTDSVIVTGDDNTVRRNSR